jgi:hypothetical protein
VAHQLVTHHHSPRHRDHHQSPADLLAGGGAKVLGRVFVLVGLAAHNTNLTPLVTGPVIELSERHAKTRSNR